VAQELEDGQYQKIVIFGIHRDVIEGLRSSLKAFDAVTLYGGTDPKTRQKNIDRFQNNPKCRVFIGNIKACGTAITLTAADQVLFVEEEWTPADNAQAAMRVHRIGQSKPVSVRITRLPDSLDQKIGGVLARKTREIAELLAEKEEFGSPRNQSHGD
jgi:SNF2 family DNA or RNA helicase